MAGVVAELVDVRRDALGQPVVLLQIDDEVGLRLPADFGDGVGFCVLSTAMRTTSAPAACSAFTCATVASMSCVCVAVMLCTAIGWPAPIVTEPMRTERVGLRGMFMIRCLM